MALSGCSSARIWRQASPGPRRRPPPGTSSSPATGQVFFSLSDSGFATPVGSRRFGSIEAGASDSRLRTRSSQPGDLTDSLARRAARRYDLGRLVAAHPCGAPLGHLPRQRGVREGHVLRDHGCPPGRADRRLLRRQEEAIGPSTAGVPESPPGCPRSSRAGLCAARPARQGMPALSRSAGGPAPSAERPLRGAPAGTQGGYHAHQSVRARLACGRPGREPLSRKELSDGR